MEDDNDPEYHLDPINEEEKNLNSPVQNKTLTLFKILFSISIIIIVCLIVVIILFITKVINPEPNNKSQPEPQKETIIDLSNQFFNYFGDYYENITYDENNKIINSFKENGDNYNKEIGNINNGDDYEKNERNIFNIYIPEQALNRKKEYNGILLWIHGGAWIAGDLTQMNVPCYVFGSQGYITVTMGYTILKNKYKGANIFRIMDEITAAIKRIRSFLEEKDFDGNKLRLAIGGGSAGAHLALLYSYIMKDITSIIPIKFVVNIVGPVGLNEKYFYTIKTKNDTFENIDNITEIEDAIKSGKLIRAEIPEKYYPMMMNGFCGFKYTDEEIKSTLDKNNRIIKDNKIYQEMLKFCNYSDVTQIEDKHKLRTICMYGGSDQVLGINTYDYLKKKAEEDNRPLDYIYSRYENHDVTNTFTEDGKHKLWELRKKLLEYFEKYFNE
jgi:hypothetical protein